MSPDGRRLTGMGANYDSYGHIGFFKVACGDIVILNNRPYLILNNAREGRFGLDEEVKHGVKRSIDLPNGEMRIIKLVF